MTENNSILDRLHGFFSGGTQAAYGAMTPEKYRQLLERGLATVPTGQALLRFAGQQRIAIHALPGKGTSGYLPENRAIYVIVPAGLSTVQPMDVLELGAYIRQAELQISGAKNPDESMTSEQFTVAFDSKIIDSVAIMCKMASEFSEQGQPEFVDALRASGHSELYETYQTYGQGDELVDMYYKLIEKTV